MAQSQKKKSDGFQTLLYFVLILAGVVLVLMGVLEYRDTKQWELMAIGVLAVIIAIGLWPIASSLSRSRGSAGGDDFVELLKSINDRLLISDTAKRIAFREKDRSTLREAIRVDIAKGDYEAALVLVDEMSRIYGYREEAEDFRAEILSARDDEVRRKMTEAIAGLDRIIEDRNWTEAVRDASRIQRLYSEWEESRGLLGRVQAAREEYKNDLINQFNEAHGRNDAEESWQILKELDDYLSPEEAAPIAERAREVVAKKRENLGIQFKLTVQEQEWQRAIQVGEQIVSEFPNSKMADEVRSMMNVLTERASGEGTAQPTGGWNWDQSANG